MGAGLTPVPEPDSGAVGLRERQVGFQPSVPARYFCGV